MSAEFDPYAQQYDTVLAGALGRLAGDVDRFASYKVTEVAHLSRDRNVTHVLDFGCGTGRSLQFIAQAFPNAQLFGFDPSEDCIAQARERRLPAVLAAAWDDIRIQQYDCILAANVFHHIPPARRADELKKCADVLRPKGSVFVFEHNPYNPATRWVFDRCPFDRDASMIRRSAMIELGRSVGLRVRRAAYTLFVPFQTKTWCKLQRPLGWLPLGAQYYVEFGKA
jgi:SAM-dependent methyltransferase